MVLDLVGAGGDVGGYWLVAIIAVVVEVVEVRDFALLLIRL